MAGEHDHSMAFAGSAFEKMKALRHPATPHNYEIWYTYASAGNAALNQTINDMIASHGTVTQGDLDELYEKFFSPTRLTDQLDCFGNQVMCEIDQIVTILDTTLDSSSRRAVALADVTTRIEEVRDPALCGVVGTLVETTKEIESANQKFEAQLKASRHEINELQKNLDAVRTEILTDPLTTLGNRKHFDQAIAKAIADASAGDAPLSLMMTDIDHFKTFNDTYGHITGDQVLRLVALTLKQNVKGQDLAARYGGEEFAVILPNTALRQATVVAEHIRRAVSGRVVTKRSTGENLGHVTISLGVAAMRYGDTSQSLLERADDCLYAAKRSGRNRVVCESDLEYLPPQAKVA